jgi:hypothetical protein
MENENFKLITFKIRREKKQYGRHYKYGTVPGPGTDTLQADTSTPNGKNRFKFNSFSLSKM